MRLLIKTLVLFTSFALYKPIFCQSEKEKLDRIDYLIDQRQFHTAFKLLYKLDSNFTNSSLVKKKHELAVQFHLNTPDFIDFAFIDIPVTDIIEDYRDSKTSDTFFHLPFPTIYEQLLKKNPKDFELIYDQMEYYFEGIATFGNEWFISPDSAFKLIEKKGKFLLENKKINARQYFIIGYNKLAMEKAMDAIPFFNEALIREPKDGEYNYNQGYAYHQINKQDSALKYYKKALSYYTDTMLKGDAARYIGFIYSEKKDYASAIAYLEMSDKLHHDQYYTLIGLVKNYLYNKNPLHLKTTKHILSLFKESQNVYVDLFALYSTLEKTDELKQMLIKELESKGNNNMTIAHLNFYLAHMYFGKDNEAYKQHLITAKTFYSSVLPGNHETIQLIDKAIKEIH